MEVTEPRPTKPGGYCPLLAAVACILALATCWVRPVSATTVEAVNLAQMTARAELVVIGWVTAIEAQLDPSGRIYTYVTLEGLEVIHGTHLEPQLELRFSGGKIDGEHQQIVGMPTFSVGEHVLLFVRGNGSHMCPLVGWDQGRFRVATDPISGKDHLTDAKGHPVMGIGPESSILYGPRDVKAPAGHFVAPEPNEPEAAAKAEAAIAQRSLAATQPMPLASFLAGVDVLRGIPAAPAQNSEALVVDGVPVDALAPTSVVPSQEPVMGQRRVPMPVPREEPVDEQ